ncbi:hypothetical protein [Bradyrhizobium uaiense]|uniref:hypothetical protein n=1 Tax=Bradyrhizobium uaiense TaxID=2594946 RepID=UPI0013D31BFF|nr:hypothetical protein [Bradyrhizobium uaiense]
MPTYLASYDLKETDPDPHETFLEKAKERGWKLWTKGKSGKWYRLPNTPRLKRCGLLLPSRSALPTAFGRSAI